jgi:hypothetical protein
MQAAVNWDAIESPLELARALWTPDGWALPPSQFKSLFDRVYASTSDLKCLWQLGGASGDYLRIHPDSIDIPSELPLTLLRSADVDARIIGLKLFRRCHPRSDEVVEEIVRAVEDGDTNEGWGGLHELQELFEEIAAGKRMITPESYQHLVNALRPLSDHDDPYTRQTARRQLEWIDELRKAN